MLEARAICDTCGHTRDWHDRDAVRARLTSDPPIERPCYREIGGAPCPCGGFRESGLLSMPAGSLSMRDPALGAVVRTVALALLVVFLGLGLLYAYRSQTPSVPEVDVSKALQDINAGQVRSVTVGEGRATLEFRDSPAHKEQTALAQPDIILVKAISDYNAAHPSQMIEIRPEHVDQTAPLVSILPGLLAVLVIGLFAYYVVRRRPSS